MLRKYLLSLGLLALGVPAISQDVNKLIKEKRVKHIISTLASDRMLGRGDYQPGIELAAKFIEKQYKRIGLEPLPGNSDFRQHLSLYHSSVIRSSVSLNGTPVPADHVTALSGSSFNWHNNGDVQIIRIAANQNVQTEVRALRKSSKKAIVIVDPSFERYFKNLQRSVASGVSGFTQSALQAVIVLGTYDDVKTYEASTEVKASASPMANIVGMIKGKTKPDEYVIFGAHYDHLGIVKPVGTDSIANGADDDASGTTAVLTLARYYKKLHNNARTLIFVAFTAEELGGYGSQYFATQVDPQKTVAMFNIEMIGKPSKFGQNSAFITGFERSDFGEILQRNLQGTAFKFYPDPYKELNLFYRSDNASLAEAGVPAHSISTDQIDSDQLYHSVKDELSTLDIGNITSTIRAIALSSRTIVNGADTPKRIPPVNK